MQRVVILVAILTVVAAEELPACDFPHPTECDTSKIHKCGVIMPDGSTHVVRVSCSPPVDALNSPPVIGYTKVFPVDNPYIDCDALFTPGEVYRAHIGPPWVHGVVVNENAPTVHESILNPYTPTDAETSTRATYKTVSMGMQQEMDEFASMVNHMRKSAWLAITTTVTVIACIAVCLFPVDAPKPQTSNTNDIDKE